MTNNFVAIPSQDIENWLESKKFQRSVVRNEIVYTRASTRNPNVLLKVYTSIRVGSDSVRGAGRDSIKACVIFDNQKGKSFGIGKFPPVLRVVSVESTIKRLEERIREAAKRGNEWIDSQMNQIQQPASNQNAKPVDDSFKDSAAYKMYLECLGLKE